MDKYELNEAQNGILAALLRERGKVDEQISHFGFMVRQLAGVGNDWKLTGTPQGGFVLIPPDTEGEC